MNNENKQKIKMESIIANANLKMCDVEAKIKHCIICGADIVPIEKVAFKNKCVICAEKDLEKSKEKFRIKIYIFLFCFSLIIFYNAINTNSELVEYILLSLVIYCAFKFLFKIFIKRMQIFAVCGAIISICLVAYYLLTQLYVIETITSNFPIIMFILIGYILHKDYKAIKVKHNVILRVRIDKYKLDNVNITIDDKIAIDKSESKENIVEGKIDKTKIDETLIVENKIDEAKIDETAINETKIDETKAVEKIANQNNSEINHNVKDDCELSKHNNYNDWSI